MLFDIIDENTGKRSRYLIDRESNVCIILLWHPEHLDQIVNQALAHGAPWVRMLVTVEPEADEEKIAALENNSWSYTGAVVMERSRYVS